MNNYKHQLAVTYFKYLNSIDWNDNIFIEASKIGMAAFLSMASMYLMRVRGTKYHQGDYYSDAAYAILMEMGPTKNRLRYEHMVPKGKYIQSICEDKAKEGTLSIEFIEELLNKYWFIAIVTKEEDILLNPNSMPEDWDEIDIFSRYKNANIILHHRDYFYTKKIPNNNIKNQKNNIFAENIKNGELLHGETWVPIKGYEDKYAIFESGAIGCLKNGRISRIRVGTIQSGDRKGEKGIYHFRTVSVGKGKEPYTEKIWMEAFPDYALTSSNKYKGLRKE